MTKKWHKRKHWRDRNALLLGFENMAGVDGPFVGSTEIRGVEGDELPWEIDKAVGSLRADGHLQVKVRGLVFADTEDVPEDLRGINDESTFRAIVSCLADDGAGHIVTVNILTDAFRASRSGDSNINTHVELPTGGCIAPIIFVVGGDLDPPCEEGAPPNPNGLCTPHWFAVTGLEGEEEE